MGDEVQVREDGPFAPGDLLEGKYRIVRPLAEGGMGAIFQATHEKLRRDVAVKILKPIENEAPDKHHQRVERFYREASFSSQLNHPNTMTIFDYGELADGGFFLVMEFLEGQSLRDLIASHGALPPATALHIAIQIASSLADAHNAGVIHRDLKPPNVMLVERGGDPYFVKVVDFGLVKKIHRDDSGGDDTLTAENTVVGSPIYVAPERFLREDADSPAVDVYALGILLYEMLVGRPPFTRDDGCTVTQLILKHVNEPPPPLHHFDPDIQLPDGLEVLIKKCLEKEPQNRIGSMDTLVDLLRSCAHSLQYNPHSPISALGDSGPIPNRTGQTGSQELLFDDETGEATRNLTADHTRPGLPSLQDGPPTQATQPPATQPPATQAPPTQSAPSRFKLAIRIGLAVFAVITAVLAIIVFSPDYPDPESPDAPDLAAVTAPEPSVAVEEAEVIEPEDAVEAEDAVDAEDAVEVEDAVEIEDAVAPEPTARPDPEPIRLRRRSTEDQEPDETPRPPVQIRMDR